MVTRRMNVQPSSRFLSATSDLAQLLDGLLPKFYRWLLTLTITFATVPRLAGSLNYQV